MRTYICLVLGTTLFGCTGQPTTSPTKEDQVRMYVGRADEYGSKGQWKDALDMMNKADSLQPGDMSTLQLRATIKGYAGDLAGAVEDLDRAIDLCKVEKQCRHLYMSRAGMHKAAGHMDLACRDWKLAGDLGSLNYKEHCSTQE